MAYIDYSAWDGHDPDRSWAELVDRFLNESRDQQQARLEDELDRITVQLEDRDALHAEIVEGLEWQIGRYLDRLEQLYRSRTGKRDGERDRLRSRIAACRQDLREERRAHWRDRQELEQERRTLLHELAEIEDTDVSEVL